MRVVIAPQSYKGTLTAVEACAAMERGLRAAWPSVLPVRVPLADGGAGTVAALIAGLGGTLRELLVEGPLGAPGRPDVAAECGMLADGFTAVIEVAAACGWALVPPARRDAMRASSYGVGQLIRAALDAGCRRIIVGLGDSATTDAGAGALAALGLRLLDADGRELDRGGAALCDSGRH